MVGAVVYDQPERMVRRHIGELTVPVKARVYQASASDGISPEVTMIRFDYTLQQAAIMKVRRALQESCILVRDNEGALAFEADVIGHFSAVEPSMAHHWATHEPSGHDFERLAQAILTNPDEHLFNRVASLLPPPLPGVDIQELEEFAA